MAGSTRTFQIRVTQEWEDHLNATIRAMPVLRGEPVNRAAFVRETVEVENLLWRRSPYVSESCNHLVMVTGEGHYLYHRHERLHVNSDLRTIPAQLEMRLEKRLHREDRDRVWGLNAFALWRGQNFEVDTDGKGHTSKSVRFTGPFTEGSRVEREGFFVLNGYAHDGAAADDDADVESLYDRADFEVDIPTRSLDIFVIVDLRLFAGRPETESVPALRFDIRNRDGVAFSSPDAVDHFLRQENLLRIGSRYEPGAKGDKRYEETVRLGREGVRHFAERLKTIRGKVTGRSDKAGLAAQIDRTLPALKLPPRFLFYRISWIGAHMGLTCSVRFPKPPAPAMPSARTAKTSRK
jgi:hypothetical protein